MCCSDASSASFYDNCGFRSVDQTSLNDVASVTFYTWGDRWVLPSNGYVFVGEYCKADTASPSRCITVTDSQPHTQQPMPATKHTTPPPASTVPTPSIQTPLPSIRSAHPRPKTNMRHKAPPAAKSIATVNSLAIVGKVCCRDSMGFLEKREGG